MAQPPIDERKLAKEIAKALTTSEFAHIVAAAAGAKALSSNRREKQTSNKPQKIEMGDDFEELVKNSKVSSKLIIETMEKFEGGVRRDLQSSAPKLERLFKQINYAKQNTELRKSFKELSNKENKSYEELKQQTDASSIFFRQSIDSYKSQQVLQDSLPKAMNDALKSSGSKFAKTIASMNDVSSMIKTIDILSEINDKQNALGESVKTLSAVRDEINKLQSVYVTGIDDLQKGDRIQMVVDALTPLESSMTTISKLVTEYNKTKKLEEAAQSLTQKDALTSSDMAEITEAYDKAAASRAKISDGIANEIQKTLKNITAATATGGSLAGEDLRKVGITVSLLTKTLENIKSGGVISDEFTKPLEEMSNEVRSKLTPELEKLNKIVGPTGLSASYVESNNKTIDSFKELQTSVNNALDIGSINDAQLENIGLTRDSMESLFDDLAKSGNKLTQKQLLAVTKLSKAVGGKLPEELNKLSDALEEASRKTDTTFNKLRNSANLLAVNFFSLGTATAALTTAFYRGYNDIKTAVTHGLDTSFTDAFSLSVDPSALTKTVAANKQIALAGGGVSQFTNTLKQYQDELIMSTGDPEAAMEFTAAMEKNTRSLGISSSVTIKGMIGTKTATDSLRGAFEGMRILTGMNIQEFTALQQELINDSNIRLLMNKMNKKEREAYQKSINLRLQENAVMGLTVEQSKEVIKTFAAMRAKGPVERMRTAAKLAAVAGAVGMSGEDTSRLRTLSGKKNLTEPEQKELIKLTTQLNDKMGGMAESSDLGQQVVAERLQSLIPTEFQKVVGIESQMRTDIMEGNRIAANQDKTLEQILAEAQRASGTPPAINNLVGIMENIKGALANPLVEMAIGLVALTGAVIGGFALMRAGRTATQSMIEKVLASKLPSSAPPPHGTPPTHTPGTPPSHTPPTSGGKIIVPEPRGPIPSKVPNVPGKEAPIIDPKAKIPPGKTGFFSKIGGVIGKSFSTIVAKKAPLGMGMVASGADAAMRTAHGDKTGAAMTMASGAVSSVPIIGTAASLLIDMALIAKDMSMINAMSEPQKDISGKDIAPPMSNNDKSFFSGLIPDMFKSSEPSKPIAATAPETKKESLAPIINVSPTPINVLPTPLSINVAAPIINFQPPQIIVPQQKLNVLPTPVNVNVDQKPPVVTYQPPQIKMPEITVKPTPVAITTPTPVVNYQPPVNNIIVPPKPTLPTQIESPRTTSVDMNTQMKSVSDSITKQLASNELKEAAIVQNTATMSSQLSELKQTISIMKDTMINVMNINQQLLITLTNGQANHETLMQKSISVQKQTNWATN